MLKAFALDTVKSSTQYLEREMMHRLLAPPRGDSAHPGGFRLEVIRLQHCKKVARDLPRLLHTLVSPLGLKDEKVPPTFAVTCTRLYYFLFCSAGGARETRQRDGRKQGGDFFFMACFIMAWYRTPPGRVRVILSFTGPDPAPDFFP